MIQIENLSYRYGKGVLALSDINMKILPGIHLLMGENGAGKTTLLHVIAGLRRAQPVDACRIDGIPTASRSPQVMSRVFIVTDNLKFPYSTINEMVRRHACFFPTFNPQVLSDCLTSFSMTGNEAIDKFSLGNRKKAILAYAIALQTPVLLLDEPANGLDIASRQILLQLLARNTSPDQTVIISTHTVSDFQYLFDSVMMMQGSSMLFNTSVWDITSRLQFVYSNTPIQGALYMEHILGRYQAVLPNIDGEPSSDINYALLYNAVHSPAGSVVLGLIKK